MKSGWETYKGIRYFLCRYNNLTLQALKVEVAEVEAFIIQQPEHSTLVLADVSGTIISTMMFDVMRSTITKVKKHIHRAAVLGITGSRRTMLDLMVKFTGLPVVAFDRQVDALEWLTG